MLTLARTWRRRPTPTLTVIGASPPQRWIQNNHYCAISRQSKLPIHFTGSLLFGNSKTAVFIQLFFSEGEGGTGVAFISFLHRRKRENIPSAQCQ